MAQDVKRTYDPFNNDTSDNASSLLAKTNKVKFLSGTQSSLNNLISGGNAIEGAFYLTNDTHRLYIGRKQKDTTKVYPEPVNEGVLTVATESDLPTASVTLVGQMYYISDANVLAICSGTMSGANAVYRWVQLNPDTYLKVGEIKEEVSVANGKATIDYTVADTGGRSKTTTHYIVEGNHTDVRATTTANEILIDADYATENLKVGAVGSDGKTAAVTLTRTVEPATGGASSTSDVKTINFKAGTNISGVAVSGDDITINAKDQNVSKIEFSELSAGGFNLDVTSAGDVQSDSFDPIIKIGDSANKDTAGTTTSLHFLSGTATLPVYTMKQVDDIVASAKTTVAQAADAMHLQGVVTATSGIASLYTVGNGTAYKVSKDIEVAAASDNRAEEFGYTAGSAYTLHAGDLLVAMGTEGSDGLIDSGKYEIIPSGDEPIYGATVDSNGFKLAETNTTAKDTLIDFELTAATNSGLVVASTGSSGTSSKLQISQAVVHSDVTAGSTKSISGTTSDTAQTANGKAFTSTAAGANRTTTEVNVISGVTVDRYGHVTGATTNKITLVDSHAHLKTITVSKGTTTNDLSIELADSDDHTVSQTVSFSSSSLTFDTTGGVVNAELNWSTF